MIHEILKILDTTDLPELDKQRITTDLLRLFSVVGQSEQLLALAQYMCQHQNNLDGKTAKDYLQDFLSQ